MQQYKVLRIFDGGAQSGDDWHKRDNPYGVNDIEKIKDPEGHTDKKQITSIPSPFARIHLFEAAFKNIASKGIKDPSALDGNTIYHKLVSDALDVGEIFFNYDLIKNKHSLGIVRWSKEKDIRTLRESSNAQHQLLGETLELYLKQDASRSNFEKMQDIFFVTLNNQIVGGTSPSTLFFTNGNDL
ncbi:MAG: hypothetical protein AAFY41_17900, partial [Bacteroidota bacterium]